MKKTANQYLKKNKLIIISIIAAFFVLFAFLIVIISPLIALGIIDADDINISTENNLTYSQIDTTSTFVWPIGSSETTVENGITYALGTPTPCIITSYFGLRTDPVTGEEYKAHGAIDIAPTNGATYGTVNIIAAKDGTVTYSTGKASACPSNSTNSDCGGGYGNYVSIEHADGTKTLYAHMYQNSITVETGDTVKAGQVIGKMGSSGKSTGMHLHFEVRINGEKVDPLNYVSETNPRPKKQTITYVEGNDNMQTICLTLKDAGYSSVAVAGIMGNIAMESNYNPNAVNYIDCIGIVQWCYDRATNVKNTYGNEWNVLENQLEYILYELDNAESAAKKYLNDSNIGVRDMAHKFCNGYERPGTEVCNMTDPNHDRMGSAENLLPYVQNGCK